MPCDMQQRYVSGVTEGHRFVHWGFRGPLATAACGLSILLASLFLPQNIIQAISPPPIIQGRGGALVVRKQELYFKPIVAYYPPYPQRRGVAAEVYQAQVATWKHTVKFDAEWVETQFNITPHQCTPLLLTDLDCPILGSKDLKNAFGCGDLSALHDGLARLLTPSETSALDEELLRQRRAEAVTVLKTSTGTIAMTNFTGGLMGRSNEPDSFMQSFYTHVVSWNYETLSEVGKPLTSRLPERRGNANGAMAGFVDDLIRILLIPETPSGAKRPPLATAADRAADFYEKDNDILNNYLNQGGHVLNADAAPAGPIEDEIEERLEALGGSASGS